MDKLTTLRSQDYVADTVSFFTLPSKLPFFVTQNLTHLASQEVD
jgi:hypothetical protein